MGAPAMTGGDNLRILITGFEPFGNSYVNPSWEAARLLHHDTIDGADLVGIRVPVSWERAVPVIVDAVEQFQPDAVLMLGESGGRGVLSVERIGVNVRNGTDNAGIHAEDLPVSAAGPAGYLTTLPIKQIIVAARRAGVPALESNTAGTYLCNCVLYGVRHALEQRQFHGPVGFIHVPQLPEQIVDRLGRERVPASQPSMDIQTLLTGLRAALQAIVAELQACQSDSVI